MIPAAVLTISDSSHEGSREDKSGPAVTARLQQSGFEVTIRKIIPDERERISATLRQLAAERSVSAIFTTGGTGVAPRDVTPEATRDVIEREIPGFGEQMRAKGLASTKFAVLSRGLAGTFGGVLI
ncbi:MAG: MogA/MoaB family molybdenum cofactor biosynthesis protein, partial [Acidobacteriota bacterium]|nr:MogA/MoaB family molybdenum cofactor biosynthesis protein [Acidobacteriota bacterium]